MTYSATYCALISKRLQNPITKNDCYCESHHIIPKSEGGPDDKDNLVNLTAREHYVAHLLLAKIYDDQKMWTAIHWMSHMNEKPYTRITSRLYSTIRAQFSKKQSEALKGKPLSEEHRRKIGEALKGKPLSEGTRRKISEGRKSKPTWNKGKIGVQVAWNKGKHPSEETRKKMSESHKGNPLSEETRKKMSESRQDIFKGRHWYNNGRTNVFAKECPEGFVPGMLKI